MAGVACVISGKASSGTAMGIPELAREADAIVHGTVESTTCRRNAQGRLVTYAVLTGVEVWKGQPSSGRFTLVLAGGTLGVQEVTVEGQAQYSPGEEVVVFARLNPQGQGVTLGLAQGKWRITTDSGTGRRIAERILPVSSSSPALSGQAGPDQTERLPLEELRERVREVTP